MLSLTATTTLGFTGAMPARAPLPTRAATVVMEGSGFGTGKRDSEGMSAAIPFLKRSPGLGAPGTYAGDIGFDPLKLTDVVPIQWAREAELKHARVCMLQSSGPSVVVGSAVC